MRRRHGVVVAIAVLAGACTSNPAQSSARVPLEIPEPPPRVAIDPVPAVITETPVAPERPAPTPPVRPPSPASSTPAAATAATPQQTPTSPVTAAEPPRTTPPPELRPAGGAGRTPTAAQVRERVVRTKLKLDSIDRRRLNTGKQNDYDSAQRFLAQADAAVKDNNLLLAESSVEKAETLADGLR